jgi:hypothetical protein
MMDGPLWVDAVQKPAHVTIWCNKLLRSPPGTTETEGLNATAGNNRRIFCGPDAALSFYTASVESGGSRHGQPTAGSGGERTYGIAHLGVRYPAEIAAA